MSARIEMPNTRLLCARKAVKHAVAHTPPFGPSMWPLVADPATKPLGRPVRSTTLIHATQAFCDMGNLGPVAEAAPLQAMSAVMGKSPKDILSEFRAQHARDQLGGWSQLCERYIEQLQVSGMIG